MLWSLALWMSLTVPSLPVVVKYAGWHGAAVYALAALAGVALRRRMPVPRSRRGAAVGGAAVAAAVFALFVAIYPRVNVHTPGAGSDDDDAHDIGAYALVHGRSPYEARTYLGNRLHQLPGAYVLAAPFALLGASALQNVFWLSLFFVALARATGDDAGTLALAMLVLALSPAVLHQVVTGTAYLSNAISVLLGMWWITQGGRGGRGSFAAAVFWGVALASRANFLWLVPLAAGWIWRHDGPRAAARAIAIVLATAALMTVPFYVASRADFGPLEASNRLTRLDAVVPHAAALVVALMSGLALWLTRLVADRVRLFGWAAAVQAVPVCAGVALLSWQTGQPDLGYASYATFPAWFGIAAVALADSAHHGPDSDGLARR